MTQGPEDVDIKAMLMREVTRDRPAPGTAEVTKAYALVWNTGRHSGGRPL